MRINYLLFDAARAGRNLSCAQELNSFNQCVYPDEMAKSLSGVAPYLFSVLSKPEFESWFFREGWGKAYGILLIANMSFADCLKHFRKFIRVQREDGRRSYFRFYDPRVLRLFLVTCDKELLRDFFGQIGMFILEDEDPAYAIQYWLQNHELKSKRIAFEELVAQQAKLRPPHNVAEETDNIFRLPSAGAKSNASALPYKRYKIKATQVDRMQHILSEKFINQEVSLIKNRFSDWAIGKDDGQLRNAIAVIVDFGIKYQVFKEENWRKLIQYKIEYKFDLALNEKLKTCLSEPHRSENYRLEKFYLALASGNFRFIPITVDSKI